MKTWSIIDVYNLIHHMAAQRLPHMPTDLAGQRQFLLRKLEEVLGIMAQRITVVFDGRLTGSAEAFASPRLEIQFSPPDKTADTLIEQMVCRAQQPSAILVVTSDRSEAHNVLAADAEIISCAAFLDRWQQTARNLTWLITRRARQTPGFTLGDLLPPAEQP